MKSSHLVIAVMLTGASAAPAWAQSASPGSDVAAAPPASAGVEDIVVTATRREERLQQVPIAVTALTGASLERTGITQSAQLAQVTPGLVLGRNTAQFQPTIRGIGSRAATIGDESNVAIYVDGIYQPEIFAGAFDFLEVQRIEVLRGPQGTLFGRNSTGGLINVITPDPSFTTKGSLLLRYGRFDEKMARGYITGALSEKVAMDLSALAYDDDGYVHDLVNGGLTGDKTSYAARSKLLLDLSEATRIVLTGSYANQKDRSPVVPSTIARNTSGRPRGANPIADEPFETALSFKPYSNVEQYGTSLRLSSDLGAASLEATTAYQHNELHQLTDSDASTVNLSSFVNNSRSRSLSQEIKLNSATAGPLQWTAGLFAFDSVGRYDPSQVLGLNGAVSSSNFARNRTVSLAGFLEGTYAFTDALKLTAGARYTWERRHFEDRLVTAAATQTVDERTSFRRLTPRAALQYEVADEANLYASYSRGFKSGVFNTGGANPIPVRPESVDAYEIGLKADPLSWLRTNFAAFYYDYKDIQVSVRNPVGVSILQNAATARMKGLEAEITAVLARDLNLRLAGAYLDAKYRDFPNAIVTIPLAAGGNSQVSANVSGNRAIRSPKFTGNVALDYSHEFSAGTIALSGNAYYSAHYYWDFANRLGQKNYVLLNARVGWTLPGDALRFSLYGDNLANAKVRSNVVSSTLGDYATYQKPRTYGVEARWSF